MPLSTEERLIATLYFDTQPARRAKYLEQLGYKLDPKDPNNYTDAQGNDYEIDPGGVLNFKQYFKKGGAKEFGSDIIEGVVDLIQGSATEAGGQVTGLAAGGGAGAATLGAAAFPAYFTGRAIGRAGTYNAIEAMKDQIGDTILKDKLPPDQALRLSQTAVQSLAPEVIAKGGQALKSAASKSFSLLSDGLKNVMTLGGGKINGAAWDWLKEKVKSGKMPSPEEFANAKSSIDTTIDSMTGTTANSGPNFGKSIFQKKMNELEPQRQAEVLKLSQDPKNAFDIKEFLTPIVEQIEKLNAVPGKSDATKAQIAWLKSKKNQLTKDIASGKVTFENADKIVKEMQRDMYDSNSGAAWRDGIKPVVESINEKMKNKATELGSPYAGIKEQEKKLFNAYDVVETKLNRDKASRAIIGGEKTGTRVDSDTKDVTDALTAVDDALGLTGSTDSLTSKLQSDQFQKHLFTQMEAIGKPSGSGGFLKSAAVAASPAIAAAGLGVPGAQQAILPMAIAGGVAATPKLSIPLAMGAEAASSAIEKATLPPQVATTLAREAVGSVPQQQPSQEPANPFLEGVNFEEEKKTNPFLEGL